MALPSAWRSRLETTGLVGVVFGLLLLFPLGGVPNDPGILRFVETARWIGLGLTMCGLLLFLGTNRPWRGE